MLGLGSPCHQGQLYCASQERCRAALLSAVAGEGQASSPVLMTLPGSALLSVVCWKRAKGKGGDLSLDDATTQQTILFSHTHALRASFPGSALLCGSGEGQGQLSCFDDLGASFPACCKWQGVKSCISPSPMSPHSSRGLALLLSCLQGQLPLNAQVSSDTNSA